MIAPPNVRRATTAWAVAVAAGVVESVLAIEHAAGEGLIGPDVWTQVGVRVVVYALATVLVVNFSRGRRWARTALTVLLTLVGLTTLLVPVALELIAGQRPVQAFNDGGQLGWPFVVVRLTHIACVVTASVLMFTTSANAYFTTRSARESSAAPTTR